MQVSFIIPLYNCLALTQECLRTLRATLPAGLTHEIVLVDDGSTDGTREWLKALGQTSPGAAEGSNPLSACRVLLNEGNRGFAATCNRGAAEAQGACLFFLNDDLVFQPGWLRPMLALARLPYAGLVGNVQLNATTGAVDHAGLWFNRKGKPEHTTRVTWAAWLTGELEVPALTGACFAVRKSLWQQVGGFDEAFVNGGEDVDLCLRVRQAGLHNYVATRSVVRHHISQSPGRKRRDEENSRRLLARWRSSIAELSARDFCPPCLAVAWEEPRNYPDARLARDAFLYHCRLLPYPTARLATATSAAFEIEFRRWTHLLDGGPPPPPSQTLVWQLFQAQPESPAVL
jgi:GT2 family glycosyltransferase